jgi:glycosyltransferase involved in cell wall biosynthesis
MSENPSISVVVPFFNSERHIAECIESLLTQKDVGAPFEIIFIDNRSKDGSAAIAARFDELIVLEEHTAGAYAARNAGIQRAQAPLIAFTDADCIVDPRWLRSIQDGMQYPEIAILLGQCLYPPAASFTLRLLGTYENAKTAYVLSRCAPEHRFGHANNMAVRAVVFEELGLFEEWERAADTELIHRMAARRPDLRLAYRPSMKITHMEFSSARSRLRRLSLYTQTNARVETFKELSMAQRAGVLGQLLRGGRGDQ